MGSKKHEKQDNSPNEQLDMFGYEGYFEKLSHQLKAELEQERKDHAKTINAYEKECKDHAVTNDKLQKKTDELDAMHAVNSRITKKLHDTEDERDEAIARAAVMKDHVNKASDALNKALGRDGQRPVEQYEKDDFTCFLNSDKPLFDKVKYIVKHFYKGSHTDLALIEIALFDHGVLKRRNGHKTFVMALMKMGFIKHKTEKELKDLTGGISSKMNDLPKDVYTKWGKEFTNEKNTCEKIGKILAPDFPLSR